MFVYSRNTNHSAVYLSTPMLNLSAAVRTKENPTERFKTSPSHPHIYRSLSLGYTSLILRLGWCNYEQGEWGSASNKSLILKYLISSTQNTSTDRGLKGLKDTRSWAARTRGMLVQIQLGAQTYVSVILCYVMLYGSFSGLIRRPRSPTTCLKWFLV
jgi:hypothetical protein